MTDETATPTPAVDHIDHTGRTTGTRWYWEDLDGWHGPLTQESAQKASDTYGVGSEIRPYMTYGVSKRTRDLLDSLEDEDLEELVDETADHSHKLANTRSYPGLAGFFARLGGKR